MLFFVYLQLLCGLTFRAATHPFPSQKEKIREQSHRVD
jgi:hypothetical protein